MDEVAVLATCTRPGEQRVTRDVLVQQAEAVAVRLSARLVEHTMQDFQVAPVTVLLRRLPDIELTGPVQQRGLLDRLAAIPEFLVMAARRHRAGIAAGRVPVASLARATVASLDSCLAHPDRRPGTYYANTYRADHRDRTLAEASAFHEAVPGHHLQITVAQQLTGLPRLRKVAWINAYLEGWALYSDRLADEMGLYSGDIARLGLLAMDSMRAARLVVDTGLHAFGWSRQRVVDYLRHNTVMTEVEIQQETNRYIEMPGQALAYMCERLEIQRLRAHAEALRGNAFDIRSFHDTILGAGPLPMTVLADVVERWAASDIKAQRR